MSEAPVQADGFTPPSSDPTRPTLTGSYGMAASTHWLATATAQSVLERGGNAFDAVVAGGFVLHVVEPHQCGPGGDLVALVAPAGGVTQVLVGQGGAPAAATIEHYRSEGITEIPGSGALAAAIPGAVEAWLKLLADYGTWGPRQVLSYAAHYARHGHLAGQQMCWVIGAMQRQFQTDWPTSAAQWLPDGAAPVPGRPIHNRAYADTLDRLVEVAEAAGPDRIAQIERFGTEWRSGFVARALVEHARIPHAHADGGTYPGILTLEDLASFAPSYEPPERRQFRGTTVVKAGPWSQGPMLLQALAILEHVDDSRLDPSTAAGAHTVLEVLKLALADRDAYYGEGTDRSVLDTLLSPDYARARAAEIGETASAEFRPGVIPGVEPFIPPLHRFEDHPLFAQAPGTGEPSAAGRGDTTHIDVVDRWGNMVSATPSGGWLQSNPTVPGFGFCLGTRLQMSWLDPESPSALRPGARPRTTLTPTLLERGGVAVTALGTPGGDQQDQWQLLYLLRTLVGGYEPQQAIDAPAIHTESAVSSFYPRIWVPGQAVVESRLGSGVIGELEARGHKVRVVPRWSQGSLSVVNRDPATGVLSAAANPRGAQGYAAGR